MLRGHLDASCAYSAFVNPNVLEVSAPWAFESANSTNIEREQLIRASASRACMYRVAETLQQKPELRAAMRNV